MERGKKEERGDAERGKKYGSDWGGGERLEKDGWTNGRAGGREATARIPTGHEHP